MEYWFYLEPYTFLFRNDKEAVVYNTLNGAYTACPKHPAMKEILDNWEDATKGYGILLKEAILKENSINQFISNIKETFSGDCVPHEEGDPIPYLFKPTLFLNSDIRVKEEKSKKSLGESVLQNLNEITLFLPSSCTKQCIHCGDYRMQISHCTTSSHGKLQRQDYEHILSLAQIVGIQQINFIAGGNPMGNADCVYYLQNFADTSFQKHLWLHYVYFNEQYVELSAKTHTLLDVCVHPTDWNGRLTECMKAEANESVHWHFIVSSETDMERLDDLTIPENSIYNVHPFYTGDNLTFFQDYVFIDIANLLSEPINRKAIFRHKVLNDNFFGKLSIVPSGDVYANVNYPPIGNIKEASLKELVYREVTKQQAWLTTRHDVEPCRHCINKDLCPSLSNYELVTGRNNLCHIHPTVNRENRNEDRSGNMV